ncbi:MAG: alpha/beta hydrolase [Lewinellaceae bacterium]|nr:alpha/beta hydrolase [Lewinellaceae bacterium]
MSQKPFLLFIPLAFFAHTLLAQVDYFPVHMGSVYAYEEQFLNQNIEIKQAAYEQAVCCPDGLRNYTTSDPSIYTSYLNVIRPRVGPDNNSIYSQCDNINMPFGGMLKKSYPGSAGTLYDYLDNNDHVITTYQNIGSVSVPAGTFNNCYLVKTTRVPSTGIDTQFIEIKLAPNVGIVEFHHHAYAEVIAGDFNFNHLKLNSYTIPPLDYSSSFTITHYHRDNNTTALDKIQEIDAIVAGTIGSTLKVCADSVAASVFVIKRKPGIPLNIDSISLNIKGNISMNGSEFLGVLTKYSANQDSAVFIYHHPYSLYSDTIRYSSLRLEVHYGAQLRLSCLPLHVYRPPVLFVHGLGSESTIFNSMKDSILNTGLYEENQLYALDYHNSSFDAFSKNISLQVIQKGISRLRTNMAEINCSFGKVDIIGHSMGGVLSRLYIQSAAYNNDVNKLITLNTPHSGSQLGNVVVTHISCGF